MALGAIDKGLRGIENQKTRVEKRLKRYKQGTTFEKLALHARNQ